MRPRLDQLEALLWISKLGSFRSAARKLRLSQPAVSSRIRELESELGVSLLDRSRHRPRVTAEGVDVLRHAEQMIGLAENFRARFGERDAAKGGAGYVSAAVSGKNGMVYHSMRERRLAR